MYLNPSFDSLLLKIVSSQIQSTYVTLQISTLTSYSNTPALLSDNTSHYSTGDLTTVTNLSINDMNCINTISIQELRQAIRQLVELAQHMIAHSHFVATTMVVNRDRLRQ
jgi:hypothetical protein